MMKIKPMLAATWKDGYIPRFPCYVQPKIDGIRCLVTPTGVVSRTLKPIPNRHIRAVLSSLCKDGMFLDGELIIPGATFQETVSAVMSKDGCPAFHYKMFDCFLEYEPWLTFPIRHAVCNEVFRDTAMDVLVLVNYIITYDLHAIDRWENNYIEGGYEGIIIRNGHSIYKFGRSTLKEGALIKRKLFEESEAFIIGFQEALENCNAAGTDNLGNMERSDHACMKYGKNMLGSLLVQDCATGVQFNVGSGFTEQQRKTIWRDRDCYVGRVLTYKHQKYGAKDKPRSPIFKSFREGGI